MKTIEYTTIDKSDWPRGPWDTEVDKKQWVDEATGLACMIRRAGHELGHWCGYVGVPRGHAAYGVEYDDIGCEVHGGLTFSSRCQHGDQATAICHLVEEGEDDDVWWLGFDCAHSGDLIPAMRSIGLRDIYRPQAVVTAETERLAALLKNGEFVIRDTRETVSG